MNLSASLLAGSPWLGAALVQVTLVAVLGLLAWLAVRRRGPALRGAIVLAALVGLLAAPGLAPVAPVWLPLPEFAWLDGADPETSVEDRGLRMDDRVPKVRVLVLEPPPSAVPPAEPANKLPPGLEVPLEPFDDPFLPPEDVEQAAALRGLTPPAQSPDSPPPALPDEPVRLRWSPAGVLAAVWLLGVLACLTRSLARLARLYRWAGRARPIREGEWTAALRSLAERYGLAAVALRESRAITSPLTMGLFRPVILLPVDRRTWSAEQRALILAHELAHVRRRDFLAGLVAELAACLCWFHPLVRWLAGRLRLEQEYAADAWAVSATDDARNYVRCLARLALELGRGRGSLAPAFWRRRPEILRRIDMLRRNAHGPSPRLGRATAWTVVALAAAACLAVAGVGPLRSAAEAPPPADRRDAGPTPAPKVKAPAAADLHGDPLPAGALARLGTTRWRHGANITFVAFGPDGKTLITAGQDNTARLWDLANGKEIRRFARPQPAEIKPPPTGVPPVGEAEKRRLEAEKERLKALEAALQAQIRLVGQGNPNSFSVALTPDGKTLAVANTTIIQLYEVETGKELRKIDGPATGLAGLLFSPDGQTLAARGADGGLLLWETSTGKELHQIKAPPQPGNSRTVALVLRGGGDTPGMAFASDGKTVAAVMTEYKEQSFTSSVRIWDVASGKQIQEIKAPEGIGISGIAFAPGGKLLAYCANGAVHLCEADTGKEVRQIRAPDLATSVVFSPDGKALATRGRAQQVRLWETETGKELYQLGAPEAAAPRPGGVAAVPSRLAVTPEVRNLAFSPDGKRIATTSGGTIRLWDAATGKELLLADGHQGPPTAVALSPDGKTAVSWGADRTIRRWEAATGKQLGMFGLPAPTTAVALSPDAQVVAVATADNIIRLVEIATGKELRKWTAPPNGTGALAFSPDGKVLAARGGDSSIRLYDVAKGSELRQITAQAGNNPAAGGIVIVNAIVNAGGRFPGGGRAGLAFSPDGKLLASAAPSSPLPVRGAAGAGSSANGAIDLYDVAAGKVIRKIELTQPVVSLVFSPDGRILATENADQSITLWEVASGKERVVLGKPPARPALNVGGRDTLFLVAGGGPAFAEPAGPVTLAFAPDGQALIARTPDHAVRVWDVTTGKEVGQFKGHEGRIETIAFAPDGKIVATGSADTTILLWDAAALMKDLPRPALVKLPEGAVESLWGDLAGEDAGKAFQAVLGLAAAPKQAVPFLGERLKPAARVDAQKIDGWIADLESDKFAVRQEAIAHLVKTGEQAVPALRKVLTSQPTIETRKRVEELLDKLTGGALSAEQLRLVRAVEALERAGTPEARQVLQALAQGAPGALPTREAEGALGRLASR